MRRELETVLPAVCTALVRPVFVPGRIELHMTVHGDGDYFKVHSDAAVPEIARREISFAYYFMVRQPRGFSGGTLRLYETLGIDPPRHEPARFKDIDAGGQHDRLLRKPVSCMRVLPLHVPSGAFEDNRFTLNGWLQS